MTTTDPILALPPEARAELAAIFTDPAIPAVVRACQRYLRESQKQRPSVVEDGHTLAVISEKARELRQLLKDSRPALERVNRQMMDDYQRLDTHQWVRDLQDKLKTLDAMCFVNPARDRAENPKRGRPAGTLDAAERAFAYQLWAIYREAHGEAPTRTVDRDTGAENGRMVRAATILGPVLRLKSDLARHFRTIEQDHKVPMDIK